MSTVQTFNPAFGSGVIITTSAGGETTGIPLAVGRQSLCLTNLGTVTVHMRAGTATSAAAATVADYPVLAGQQVTITRFQDFTNVATISPAGAGSLHVMGGEGF